MAVITDPIADYLTRVRNALLAGHLVVEIPASKMKKSITEILYEHGYIFRYKFEDTPNNQGIIKIALKYDPKTNASVIRKLKRVSKPGLRKYAGSSSIPRTINGLGLTIVSTSRGVMTDKKARSMNIGGEVLCQVY